MPAASKPSGADRLKFCLQSTTQEKIANPSCDLSRYLLLSERHTLCKFLGRLNCSACSLALEPVEVRTEKVIMLAEAYTIFGALFLGGTWVLYEWGSPIAIEEGDVFNRIFSAAISVVICCNLFLALWSCILWITAIVYGSRGDFVYNARHLIQFCNHLMWMTYFSVTFGCGLALYLNLRSNLIDLIVISMFVGIVILRGMSIMCELQLSTREELREKAVVESEYIQFKANFRQIKKELDSTPDSGICILLRTAAKNMNRPDYDVSKFETNLAEDWFNEVEELKHRSVECLAKYMPLRLAEEVHKLVGDIEVGVSVRGIS